MGGAGFGMPGATGGGGPGSTAALGPASFKYPNTAVQAFLAALKAKNKDRLAQATADRAPTEAEEKHRKIFAAIKEQSISDDELDEMAKALDGYQVMSVLPAKSTRRIGVVVSKMDGRDLLQRTIMTRQERDGWKVLDIEIQYEFKAMPNMRYGRPRTGR
jgi:hypothetical protein